MLGVAPEHIRQLLLEGPVRVKEGREGKVRELGAGAEKMRDSLKRRERGGETKRVGKAGNEKRGCVPVRASVSRLCVYWEEDVALAKLQLFVCP